VLLAEACRLEQAFGLDSREMGAFIEGLTSNELSAIVDVLMQDRTEEERQAAYDAAGSLPAQE
jgi:hypothetical protein